MAVESASSSGTTWVWCQTCKRKGLVNRKLGIRGTIQACSACQNGVPPDEG